MRYVSTRGQAPDLSFDEVLIAGLADDGGLYVPESWPRFSKDIWRSMRRLSYGELAVRIIEPFVKGSLNESEIEDLVTKAYGTFRHQSIAPLRQMDHNLWMMELFHGPTLAFKDYALQLVGHMFDHVLKKRDTHVTIVGATSGDTGSAAIAACENKDAIDIFILHPHGRVSDVQRKQMTTVRASNVYNVAVKGTFDDCQNLVKAMFGDAPFRTAMNLSAVNSINWARIMAQIVYYAWAALSLGAPDRSVSFAVPTGNFGNVFAGYVAKKMGLPIEQLIIGSNANDILPRFFETGAMTQKGVTPSISPSMDIQISSNFERLLFDLYDRDADSVKGLMDRFKQSGNYDVAARSWKRACSLFNAHRRDDNETRATMADFYKSTGIAVDPHTAIGLAAARARHDFATGTPVVALSTAHPAKFPDAVQSACGIYPELPPHLSDLFDREERYDVAENALDEIESYVRKHARVSVGE